ncbi:MAG: DUF2189 domain-containing protein [Terasakiella sp.]|uniref:DUF2189 domain-containing protein n=1 Tax=unclassified Terasakiella TaxID=2614952 RepID=UPI003B00624A
MSDAVILNSLNASHANKVHIEAPAKWLRAGWHDFKMAPGVGLTYGAIFVLAGYGLFWGLEALNLTYLILPLSGSFILFAPWLALGLYEVSRLREKGETPTFANTCMAWKKAPRRLGLMAFVLLLIMMVWTQVAVVLYALILGGASLSLENISIDLLSHTDGIVFLTIGSGVGLIFACLVFLLTAVSVPLILDREIGTFEAMAFSVKTVMKNSHVMWSWAFTIAIIAWFALASFFVGLVIAMPVLGYASWHAYRDLVPVE